MAMPPHPTPAQAERPPAASPELLDRANPEAEIARAVQAFSNWGRWGADDVLGTVNFISDELRRAAAGLVRRGASFSLSQRFDMDGPQKGWRRRTNPVHTMLDTGTDAAAGLQGFPHGIGGADDVIAMPLQCSTQWDAPPFRNRPAHPAVRPRRHLAGNPQATPGSPRRRLRRPARPLPRPPAPRPGPARQGLDQQAQGHHRVTEDRRDKSSRLMSQRV